MNLAIFTSHNMIYEKFDVSPSKSINVLFRFKFSLILITYINIKSKHINFRDIHNLDINSDYEFKISFFYSIILIFNKNNNFKYFLILFIK